MLRILHITWSGDLAGSLYELVSIQKEDRDLDVFVCFANKGHKGQGIFHRKISDLGIPIYDLKMRRKYNLLYNFLGGWRLHNILKSRRFDVIHFHECLLIFPFLAAVFHRRNLKILVHNHGEFSQEHTFFLSFLMGLKKKIYGFLVGRYASKIIAVSNYVSRQMIALGISRDKIIIVQNAIDLKFLENIRKNYLRKKLGIPNNELIVGIVARLVRCKRIDRFLKAIRIAANVRKKQDLRYVIIGNGPLLKYLKALVHKTSLGNQVFFTGWVEDARRIMSEFDIFVLPSQGEAFGIAALEALALGLPVIVFRDGGGLTEIVEDGFNGFIVNNEEELALRVLQLSRNQELRRKLGFNAMRYSMKFNIRDYAKKIKKILELVQC